MRQKTNFMVVMGLIFCFLGGPVGATPITPTDFGALALGSFQVEMSADITSFFGDDIGDLTSKVYENAGTYTYVLEVTPAVNNVSEFSTSFAVDAFNGVAGYSFSEAETMGVSPTIYLDTDGTIDWMVSEGYWGANEKVTLFYQSSNPYLIDWYNMTNSTVGMAQGYAADVPPIPDASAVFLLGSACLLGFAGLRRKRRQ